MTTRMAEPADRTGKATDKERRMPIPNHPDRRGFALVTTLLVVLVLSILAIGIAWLAGSERTTSHADGVHVRSVLAADAGSEAGINFLRVADRPPAMGTADGIVAETSDITLSGSQSFSFACAFVSQSFRPGWGVEFPNYDYAIQSSGQAAVKGQGFVKVIASRMFQTGY